ncbi:hypothetical protein PRUPE_4G106800 [Prunus persica]|uniref:Uncharacterized protein n=1 Tax=Prunus persica TaxID=3760 RepID=A0A251PIR8_PRUPE|nr:hypothetical protein PRUPE_4G106800 [Prunus persica]
MIFSQTSFALGVPRRGEEVTPPLSLSLFPYLPTYFSSFSIYWIWDFTCGEVICVQICGSVDLWLCRLVVCCRVTGCNLSVLCLQGGGTMVMAVVATMVVVALLVFGCLFAVFFL